MTLTKEQKTKLEKAGIDWRKLAKQILPLVLAIIEQLLEDTEPVRPTVGGEVKTHCLSHKENLKEVLKKLICAAHCLAHEIDCCPDEE